MSLVHAIEPQRSLYENTVLALSQLMILARSRRVVADPGSDMYALIRFFRLRIRGSQEVINSRSHLPVFTKGLVTVIYVSVAHIPSIAIEVLPRRTGRSTASNVKYNFHPIDSPALDRTMIVSTPFLDPRPEE